MKFVLVLAVACTALLVAPAHAETPKASDPIALGHAREIVDALLPADSRMDMMTQMMRSISDQVRGSTSDRFNDAGLRQIIDGYLAKLPERLRPATERFIPSMLDAMTKAYVREFTPAELAQVASFARTPAGRHYLSRSSAILSDPDVAAANRTFFAEAQQVSLIGQAELRQAITDYLTKHPDVARKMVQEDRANSTKP